MFHQKFPKEIFAMKRNPAPILYNDSRINVAVSRQGEI